MNGERNTNLDFIRVVACIFVIAIHTDLRPFESSKLFLAALNAVLFACNGFFFMISGWLNLDKEFHTKKDWLAFYGKKSISMFFPFAVILLATYILTARLSGHAPSLQGAYAALMSWGSSSYHLWFVFTLTGFVLSTPLLSKAFHAMSDAELKLVFVICLVWNVAGAFMTKDFNIEFGYSGWILSGWITSYFAGYYCRRIVSDANKKWFYILGAAGFAASVLCAWLIRGRYFELAASYVLYTMALFIFLTRQITFKRRPIRRIVGFLAKYSYLVYLIHLAVMSWITPRLMFIDSPYCGVRFVEMIVITYAVSLVIAIVLDFVFFAPLEKLMRRGLGRLLQKERPAEP